MESPTTTIVRYKIPSSLFPSIEDNSTDEEKKFTRFVHTGQSPSELFHLLTRKLDKMNIDLQSVFFIDSEGDRCCLRSVEDLETAMDEARDKTILLSYDTFQSTMKKEKKSSTSSFSVLSESSSESSNSSESSEESDSDESVKDEKIAKEDSSDIKSEKEKEIIATSRIVHGNPDHHHGSHSPHHGRHGHHGSPDRGHHHHHGSHSPHHGRHGHHGSPDRGHHHHHASHSPHHGDQGKHGFKNRFNKYYSDSDYYSY